VALATANLEAARVPLRTAGACLRLLEISSRVAKLGNVNAITDAGVASLLARAAGEGALLNVEINLKSVPDGADKQGVEMDLHRLQSALATAQEGCRDIVRSVLSAS
jgi:formiminotetrahydrofolate cyclodeaminase